VHALDRETEKKRKKEKQVEKKHRACIECFLKRRNSDDSPVTELSVESELDAGSEAGEDAASAAGVGLLELKATHLALVSVSFGSFQNVGSIGVRHYNVLSSLEVLTVSIFLFFLFKLWATLIFAVTSSSSPHIAI